MHVTVPSVPLKLTHDTEGLGDATVLGTYYNTYMAILRAINV